MRSLQKRGLSLALVAAAAAYATAPILSGLHLATVPHYFCVEHGTLEHHGCDDCHEPEPEVDRGLSPRGVSSSQTSPVPHQHQLCSSIAATQRSAQSRRTEARRLADEPRGGPSLRPDVRPLHGLLVLDLAPKSSPPATA